ncbi:hypothetical protein GF361_01350 [Candidatus Woesearchaeota archaeon]|nr:hypothetical protein [Candidatus Woesearchaeota archaeon]
MVSQDEIVNVIRHKGPLLPSTLAKEIGTNILIASAHLSDLVDKKKVFVSNTKVGGSPVYYIEGQKSKLQDFASNLNEKDQETLEFLKKNKVLRDDKLDQLKRVSLRNIKDFAVPLQVTKGNEKILFWKWFLISNQEAESLIKQKLESSPVTAKKTEEPKQQDIRKENQKSTEENKKSIEEEKKRAEEERKKSEERKALEDQKKKEEEKKKAEQKKKIQEEREREKKKLEQEKKKIEEERKKIQEEREKLQEEIKKERQSLLKEIQNKDKEGKDKQKKIDDPFLKQIIEYLDNKKIHLNEYNIIRKKSEIDLVLKIPSVIGDLDYYCKAKKKMRVSDSDLSSAIVKGQSKKLPIIFLTTGKLNRKAKKLMNSEFKGSIVIKKI